MKFVYGDQQPIDSGFNPFAKREERVSQLVKMLESRDVQKPPERVEAKKPENKPQEKPKLKQKRRPTRQDNPLMKRGRHEITKQAKVETELFLNGLDNRNQISIRLLCDAFGADASALHITDLNTMERLIKEAGRRIKSADRDKIINFIMKSAKELRGNSTDSQEKTWRKLRAFWVVNP